MTFSALPVVVVEDVVVVGCVVVVALVVVVAGFVVVVGLVVVVLLGKGKLKSLAPAVWNAALAGKLKSTTGPTANIVAKIAKTKPGRLLRPCCGPGRNDVLDISPPQLVARPTSRGAT
ncbi:MAG TPA: hypothetical protein VED59_05935 [Acidimicrobiales bacterium]|nr:hypothetical protein [Acidimicrobiales bacterium]